MHSSYQSAPLKKTFENHFVDFLENTIRIEILKPRDNSRKSMLVTLFVIFLAYEVLYNEDKKFLYDRVGRTEMNDPMVYNKFNFQALKGP